MVRYIEFKRSLCARTVTQLMSPTITDTNTIALPYHSVLHFIDGPETGIPSTHPLIVGAGRVFVHHVEDSG